MRFTEVILLYNPLKFFLLLAAGSFLGAATAGWLWELTPLSLHPLLGGLSIGGLGAACIFAIGGAGFAMAGQRRLPTPAQSETDAGKLPPLEIAGHADDHVVSGDGGVSEGRTSPPAGLGDDTVPVASSPAAALKEQPTLDSEVPVSDAPAGRKSITLDP
jgi:hypothetical protein